MLVWLELCNGERVLVQVQNIGMIHVSGREVP
jgi:hypothetical protein